MRFLLTALALSLLTMTVAGCGSPEHMCTDYAAFSATIKVLDTSGAPLPGATVTYTIDGGEVRTADCFASSNNAECSEFVTVAEQPGDFSITVARAGYQTEQRDVTVVMDDEGCHVVEQVVTVTLTPAA